MHRKNNDTRVLSSHDLSGYYEAVRRQHRGKSQAKNLITWAQGTHSHDTYGGITLGTLLPTADCFPRPQVNLGSMHQLSRRWEEWRTVKLCLLLVNKDNNATICHSSARNIYRLLSWLTTGQQKQPKVWRDAPRVMPSLRKLTTRNKNRQPSSCGWIHSNKTFRVQYWSEIINTDYLLTTSTIPVSNVKLRAPEYHWVNRGNFLSVTSTHLYVMSVLCVWRLGGFTAGGRWLKLHQKPSHHLLFNTYLDKETVQRRVIIISYTTTQLSEI